MFDLKIKDTIMLHKRVDLSPPQAKKCNYMMHEIEQICQKLVTRNIEVK